jgi:hypothetical protein
VGRVQVEHFEAGDEVVGAAGGEDDLRGRCYHHFLLRFLLFFGNNLAFLLKPILLKNFH